MRARIRTEHSDYVIEEVENRDSHTLTRIPREVNANSLRADTETVELLEVLYLEVGQKAEFLIQLPHVNRLTVRWTTIVESIIHE